MTVLGSVGAVAIVDEVAVGSTLKKSRITVVGDAAYHAGGSIGLAAAFSTAAGQDRTILGAHPSGPNGDMNLEYTPRGAKKVATVVASTDVFTCTAHGLASTDPVQFFVDNSDADLPASVLPAGVVAGTTYYVIASGLTANAFKVSAGLAGATINVTDAGTGKFRVQKQDTLLGRIMSTGIETTDADQSDTTYGLLVDWY